jgi:hypothetical protein
MCQCCLSINATSASSLCPIPISIKSMLNGIELYNTIMYVSPVKHEEEEKVVFRTSRPQPSRLIQKRSNLEIET